MPHGDSLIPALAEGTAQRRQDQMQTLLQEVGADTLNDVSRSVQDPHNQEGRALTPERLKVQQLMESGFADTLFSVAGRPRAVAAPEDMSRGLQGSFTVGEDSVAIQTNTPTSLSEPQILSHELGHRLLRTLVNSDFREQFESAVDSVQLERGKEVIDSFFLNDPEMDPSEAFAESFRGAVNVLRSTAENPEQMDEAVQDQVLSVGLNLEDLSEQEIDTKIRAVTDFLLDQPLFEDHPLNRLREVEEQTDEAVATQDVTRTENENGNN